MLLADDGWWWWWNESREVYVLNYFGILVRACGCAGACVATIENELMRCGLLHFSVRRGWYEGVVSSVFLCWVFESINIVN